MNLEKQPTPFSPEESPMPSQKEQRWNEAKEGVDHIADNLKQPVDERIKTTVTALLVHEFPTSGSCEGHPDRKHGLAYPWVEIYSPEPEGWEKDEAKKEAWTTENLQQQQRLMNLLEQFYVERKTSFDARLTFSRIGIFGGFRLQSQGVEVMRLLPESELNEKNGLYRKEMDDFAEFLRKKFLSE